MNSLFMNPNIQMQTLRKKIQQTLRYRFSPSILILFFCTLCLLNTNCKKAEQSPDPSVLPYFSGKDFDPVWTENPENDKNLKKVPDSFELTEHTGKQIFPKDWAPSEHLVVFFYATCRGICPLITRNLIQIEPNFSEFPNLKIFSISIHSKKDTVPVLQNYRKTYQIKNPNWSFFTGKETEIENFAKETCGAEMEGFSVERGKYEFVHTENIFLFDKDRYLRGIYRAKGTGDIQRLVEDLKKLRQKIN
ncbi:SCO family protein [Leptospira kanakyensis]|uniref:SCO family protein n=1 Tax=Leptospira kanakyensis TaxID=2484968 RepID=A0A6N4Q8Q0_9LEPT|nr:SCO family protein [Leptospira kanakyensis]TGK55484.1 SCO family protein [Leptospira kanakyensis]TGK61018.1 SCO family protein [Leptospira kanakyensis]TGK76509.1 SCO family protein [Leptospira kanakyensis]